MRFSQPVSQATGTPDMLSTILRNVFGFSQFRHLQRETIEAFIARRDCFVCLATG
jgi:superfamily II DNA helicase RecQ